MAKVVFYDFWAPWCGPCRITTPLVEELEQELKEVEFKKINVDEDKEALSQKYGVMSIPTFIVEKDGKEVGRRIGATTKTELIKLIQS